MKEEILSEIISEINDKYYEEAALYEFCGGKRIIKKLCAAAACIAVVFTIVLVLPQYINRQKIMPYDKYVTNTDDKQNNNILFQIHISMNNIFINDIEGILGSTRIWYDPELYDFVSWNRDDLIKYYGKDLTPAYIPEGLTPASNNYSSTIIVKKDGTVESDEAGLNFYHDYYEDGSPKLTEEVSACKGFRIRASKTGLINDCLYIMPENEIKISKIGKIDVTFGYCSMPYGPYDPTTHEPSGYYDMYVAEFIQNGIEYQIVAEQMDIKEIVKVTASIIYGNDDIVIE